VSFVEANCSRSVRELVGDPVLLDRDRQCSTAWGANALREHASSLEDFQDARCSPGPNRVNAEVTCAVCCAYARDRGVGLEAEFHRMVAKFRGNCSALLEVLEQFHETRRAHTALTVSGHSRDVPLSDERLTTATYHRTLRNGNRDGRPLSTTRVYVPRRNARQPSLPHVRSTNPGAEPDNAHSYPPIAATRPHATTTTKRPAQLR
jgi:hypothetical protein